MKSIKTKDIEGNPWNSCHSLAELAPLAQGAGHLAKGHRFYRRAQLALEIVSTEAESVDAEAWMGMARADLAKSCWAFLDAEAQAEVSVVMELGRRLG